MPTIYHGITVPDLTDPPNAPEQLRAIVDTGGAVPRFATLADANTAYPVGQRPVGMFVGVGTRLYISNGTAFVSVSAGGIENFPNAAARTAAIPSPVLNTTTTLDSTPGWLWVWDGTAWQPNIEGRPYGKARLTSDGNSATITGGAVGPVFNFSLPTARCVGISVTSQHYREGSVGLVDSKALVDGNDVLTTLLRSYHAVLGGGGKQMSGITGFADLASGNHTAQFHIANPNAAGTAIVSAGSTINVWDAGPNRGLYPF